MAGICSEGALPIERNDAFYWRCLWVFARWNSSAETAQASGGERVDLKSVRNDAGTKGTSVLKDINNGESIRTGRASLSGSSRFPWSLHAEHCSTEWPGCPADFVIRTPPSGAKPWLWTLSDNTKTRANAAAKNAFILRLFAFVLSIIRARPCPQMITYDSRS